jgi:hypothetical protein
MWSKAHLILLKFPPVYIANGNNIASLPNRQLRLESFCSLLANQANQTSKQARSGDHLHISHKGTDNGI